MSLKTEVAAALHEHAEKLEMLASSWPNRSVLEAPREAIAECSAILTDAATELTKTQVQARA